MDRENEYTLVWDVLVCAQNPSLNPQMLVSALELYAPQWMPDGCICKRMEVFDANGTVFR